jgi:hypothetical protein
MTSHAIAVKPTTSVARGTSRFAFWAAIAMSASAAVSLTVAVLTPPRSGPFCQGGCVGYPYTDIAAFFPRDYLWMYPALLLTPLFVICMACIHHHAASERKLFSLIGLAFAVMSAGLITLDYFIQLTVIQPSLINGESAGLTLISQYNPHGLFIALEALGYLLLGLAFGFAGLAFAGRDWAERWLRRIFSAGCVLAVGGLIALALAYGHRLEYRFEVLVIMVDWLVLIVSGALLSVVFRRAGQDS